MNTTKKRMCSKWGGLTVDHQDSLTSLCEDRTQASPDDISNKVRKTTMLFDY